MDRRTDSRARFSNISLIRSPWFVRGSHYCVSYRRNITSLLLTVVRANYLSNKFSKKKKGKNWFVASSRWSINHASNFEKNCSFSFSSKRWNRKIGILRRIYESCDEARMEDVCREIFHGRVFVRISRGRVEDNDFNIRLINYSRLGRVKRSEHSCVRPINYAWNPPGWLARR